MTNKMNKRINVILYCRVCTMENESNDLLNLQESALRIYCKCNNYNVVKVFREDSSAKQYGVSRPEIEAIYEYCRKHKGLVDKVLFHRWDRFSRNLEFAFIYKRKLYDELGVEINAIESPINFRSSEWSTLLSFYCGVFHTEDEKISKRTREGIRSALYNGHWCKPAPIGYKHHRVGTYRDHNTKMVIDKRTAPLVKQIFEEVSNGVNSPDTIRKQLCPKMRRSSYMKMLSNILYIGKISVPAYRNEPEIMVDAMHPAIIDEDTFFRVQKIIANQCGNC